MVQVTIKDMAGKSAGQVEIPAPAELSAADYQLVARAIERQRTNARASIAHTKTRAEVSGGGKKPWRQKGTGRARVGSSRSPIWTKGGITFGPRNTRNWSKGLNKRERRRAIRLGIQEHALRGSLHVVDSLTLSAPKTKDAAKFLAGFNLGGQKVLVVLPEVAGPTKSITAQPERTHEGKRAGFARAKLHRAQRRRQIAADAANYEAPVIDPVLLSFRNLDGVTVIPASRLNALLLIHHDAVVLTRGAWDTINGLWFAQ